MMVNVYHRVINPITFKRSAWVYGDMGRSISLITFLNNGFLAPYAPTRVIARGEHKRNGMRINDVPVRGFDSMEDIDAMMSQGKPNMIIFPDFASVKRESDELVEYCLKNNIEMMVAPDYEKMTDPAHARKRIREIRIEDLLGRNVITLPMESVKNQLEGKVVMVTGAAGSIGSEIARQLSKMNLKELILFDNAESPLHNIRLELESSGSNVKFHPVIGDIRASKRLKYIFEKYHPQYIFHAAAYKHVPLMEENPCESIGVNVKGTRQLALYAIEYGVEKFVMVSTDKAVNPTNVMGATKRVAEMMVQTLDAEIKKSGKESTKFITTRFGNVLGSNGSVIPLFRKQIEEGGPVTVTHPDIIRYFMTIPEACSLVLEAGTMGKGGEIFAFDMGQPMKIDTLARRMIKLAGFVPDVDIPIVYSGLRPGEKLYEEVLNEEETTMPTPNPKIRIAQVRECDPQEVTRCVDAMIDAAKRIEVMESVKAIKELVPEYLSKNSPYEVLDKKQK
ncbi:UDP-N-acetylglucosamine 4,6-dehydratase family protein [Porphyromonas pogonae]|uniref:UDP-N-acetylglucosamine 4,6-dehydratase family protein n=1 Tax=Porphyromonas pogonae TaxID=867595 RepID=UPI002E7A247E|nr:nucleoside-diphosphate sugar epimerase/dehydratase [Porphyromonas pogonae]